MPEDFPLPTGRTFIDPERSAKYIRTAQDHYTAAQEYLEAAENADTSDEGAADGTLALAHLKSCELLLMWKDDIKPSEHWDWAMSNKLETDRMKRELRGG